MKPAPERSESDWRAFYDCVVSSAGQQAGYYNHNYLASLDDQQIVLREPAPGGDDMDLRLWPEDQVIATAYRVGIRVPKLIYVSRNPPFQVLTHIDGVQLDQVCPRGQRLPGHVIEDLVGVIARLHQVEAGDLPTLPADWPTSGDSSAFSSLLVSKTQKVFDQFRLQFGWLYERLGVPPDPLAQLRSRLAGLRSRPFRFLHCDLHRKNLVVRAGQTWVLDWELALWGDPAYEVAVHLHKMSYLPDERDHFLRSIADRVSSSSFAGLQDDLPRLLAHERCKSVIVDTVRYAKQIRDPSTSPTRAATLCKKLSFKLSRTIDTWNNPQVSAQELWSLLSGSESS